MLRAFLSFEGEVAGAQSTTYVTLLDMSNSQLTFRNIENDQDTGNTNYSLHLPRSAFDRNKTAEVIVRAVRSLGIKAEVNERNDICAEGYKISAYVVRRDRVY